MAENTPAAPALEPVKITQYERLVETLAAMSSENKAAVFQYQDPKGNKLARSHVHKLRLFKGEIEAARKEAKASALDYSRRVDAVANDMKAKVEALIKPHQDQIDAIENRENERKARHAAVLAKLRGVHDLRHDTHSDHIKNIRAEIAAIDTAALEEFAAEGAAVKSDAMAFLDRALSDAERRESEAAELAKLSAEAAARAEVERIESAKREAVEAERRRADAEASEKVAAAARAEQAAKDDAERAKSAAEQAEANRIVAERRAAELESRAKADAERRKADEERARREAAQAAADATAMRSSMVANIAEDLAKLKAGGFTSSATALAECIVAGRIRHVRAVWGTR